MAVSFLLKVLAVIIAEDLVTRAEFQALLTRIPCHFFQLEYEWNNIGMYLEYGGLHSPGKVFFFQRYLASLLITAALILAVFYVLGPLLDWFLGKVGQIMEAVYDWELVDLLDYWALSPDGYAGMREWRGLPPRNRDQEQDQGQDDILMLLRVLSCIADRIFNQLASDTMATHWKFDTDPRHAVDGYVRPQEYPIYQFVYYSTVLPLGYHLRLGQHLVTLCRRQLRGENSQLGFATLVICTLGLLYSLCPHPILLLQILTGYISPPLEIYVLPWVAEYFDWKLGLDGDQRVLTIRNYLEYFRMSDDKITQAKLLENMK